MKGATLPAMQAEATMRIARYRSMGNLPFWLGLGAAQKGAGSKGLKPSRHPIISLVVGILIALAISCWNVFPVGQPAMRRR
jgi:hypothetical protein